MADASTDSRKTPWSGRGIERLQRVQTEHEHHKREALASNIPFGLDVLDVGCGNQMLKAHLSNPYTGLDFESDLDPDILSDSRSIPVPDNEYHVVVAKDHLTHVLEWPEVIMEMRRVASEQILVMERSWQYETQLLQTDPFPFHAFNIKEMCKQLNPHNPGAVEYEEYIPPDTVRVIEGSMTIYRTEV